ncbi:hypothetical protein HPB52_005911 [Rhipicephalus sanguineus]|uniref:Uncharacterized protein n=1 Tax=Rhipicephalus sanguineus TaxID=34632 RepID=A0A9D4STE6_RHISA|nr:hypothetical protein HPB52_005911 [Rhipicephalus sanguineus]
MQAALLLLVASSSAATWPPPPTWTAPPALENRPRSPQYITEPSVFRHGSFVYRSPPSLQYPGHPPLRPAAATPSAARLTTAQLAYVLIGSCTALSVLCLAAVAGCSFHRCRRQRHSAAAAAAARAATHLLDPSWSLGPRNVGGTFGRCRLPFGAASSLRGGGAGPAPPSECSTCVPPPRCTCVAAAGEWSMPVCWTSNDERLV